VPPQPMAWRCRGRVTANDDRRCRHPCRSKRPQAPVVAGERIARRRRAAKDPQTRWCSRSLRPVLQPSLWRGRPARPPRRSRRPQGDRPRSGRGRRDTQARQALLAARVAARDVPPATRT